MKNNFSAAIDGTSKYGNVSDLVDALSLLIQANPLLPTSDGRVIDVTAFNISVNCIDGEE